MSSKNKAWLKSTLFPKGVNSDKLILTPEGEYSVCNPTYAEEVSRVIKLHITSGESAVITDATGNNGGNTLNFAKHFKHVNSIEVNTANYQALVNNINVYDDVKGKITTYNDDYTKIYTRIKQDIIYIDPPWGGRDYKKQKNIILGLGEYSLSRLCTMLRNYTRLIVLRVPSNFDINELMGNTIYVKYTINVIYNKFLIIVIYTDHVREYAPFIKPRKAR